MGREDRNKVEIAFAKAPYFRRWAKDVNEAIEEGTGFTSTTSTTVTTTTFTTTTTTLPEYLTYENVYAWSQGGDALRKFDDFSASLLQTITGWPFLAVKYDLTFDNDGNLIFMDKDIPQAARYVGFSKTPNGFVTNMPPSDGQGICWKRDTNDLIVLGVPGVNSYQMSGFSNTIANQIVTANITVAGAPYSAAWDHIENNLVVIEPSAGDGIVSVLNGFSEVLVNRFTIGSAASAGIAVDQNGDLLVMIPATNSVYKLAGPISIITSPQFVPGKPTFAVGAPPNSYYITVGP